MKKSYEKEFIGKIIRTQWLTRCKNLVDKTQNKAGEMACFVRHLSQKMRT